MADCNNCGKIALLYEGLCGDCNVCKTSKKIFTGEICHKCESCNECCPCSPEIEHSDEKCGDMYENCVLTFRLCCSPGNNGASKIIENSRKYLCLDCKFKLYAETLKLRSKYLEEQNKK